MVVERGWVGYMNTCPNASILSTVMISSVAAETIGPKTVCVCVCGVGEGGVTESLNLKTAV